MTSLDCVSQFFRSSNHYPKVWCTGKPVLLPSWCCWKSSSLLLHPESQSSACGTTAALHLLGILSTHPHLTPSCRHTQPPSPHKGGHWHSETGRAAQWPQVCDQSGATSVRETLSKWRKAREDLAPGVTGAEQRMQERGRWGWVCSGGRRGEGIQLLHSTAWKQ